MKACAKAFRWIGWAVLSLAMLAALAIGLLLNWRSAHGAIKRPRLCLVARNRIPAGTALDKDLVEWRLRLLSARTSCVQDPSLLLGRFSTREIAAQEPLDPAYWEPVPADPATLVTFPVPVRASYT